MIYKAILWVKAETEASINADFVTLANLLDLPEKHEQDQRRIVEAVKRWFQEHTGWLLILDNADDIPMVRGFIPVGSKGHVLLTTRAHATGGVVRRIEVEKMEPGEGALFLLHRAKLLDPVAPLETTPKTVQDIARRNREGDGRITTCSGSSRSVYRRNSVWIERLLADSIRRKARTSCKSVEAW